MRDGYGRTVSFTYGADCGFGSDRQLPHHWPRRTYEVGTDNMLKPQVLRSYNELLHCVAGAVVSRETGSDDYSVESIVEMIQEFGVLGRNNRIADKFGEGTEPAHGILVKSGHGRQDGTRQLGLRRVFRSSPSLDKARTQERKPPAFA